jgi:UDP-GlcNAc:undecaprenyl-phosphate/decaprenyl-phosphate GlcNAc-1-phosphate transferase
LGFLRYNTYPARIFLGDGGSQLLGFIMGVLVILLTNSTTGPFSPALALFLLGLPFLDTLGVAGQRLAEGRSPFVGDRKHIHHKLMTAGLSHYKSVMVIYAIQAGMVGLAYLLRWQSDILIVPLYLILAGAVLAVFVASGYGLISIPAPKIARVRSDSWLSDVRNHSWLSHLPIQCLAAAIPFLLIVTAILPTQVPQDIGYTSIALFVIVLVGLSFLPRLAPYFVRGGLYLGSTFLLYVSDDSWMKAISPLPMIYHLFFGAITLMVLLSMRIDNQNRFQTTPLDYLMVCLALILPFLPEVGMDISAFGLLAAKLIVLFFSFELLLHAFSNRVRQLGVLSLAVLFGLGIRMWL